MLFGSNAIGLALPSSDVDVLLVGFTCNSREECGQLLSHLGYLLSYMGWVASCEVFTSAKVPVLRL
jgi:DNA polymerase sigma